MAVGKIKASDWLKKGLNSACCKIVKVYMADFREVTRIS